MIIAITKEAMAKSLYGMTKERAHSKKSVLTAENQLFPDVIVKPERKNIKLADYAKSASTNSAER